MSTFRLLALYCLVREGGRTIFINFCTSSNIAYHVNLPLTISVKFFSSRNITYPPQPPGSPDIVFTCFYMCLYVLTCFYCRKWSVFFCCRWPLTAAFGNLKLLSSVSGFETQYFVYAASLSRPTLHRRGVGKNTLHVQFLQKGRETCWKKCKKIPT